MPAKRERACSPGQVCAALGNTPIPMALKPAKADDRILLHRDSLPPAFAGSSTVAPRVTQGCADLPWATRCCPLRGFTGFTRWEPAEMSLIDEASRMRSTRLAVLSYSAQLAIRRLTHSSPLSFA